MAVSVRLVKRAASHTVRLEVHYPGLEPPTALFDDLTMIGWRVPPAEPPPAHAIDWTSSDPASPHRYRIRPWDATAVVEPPVGTGWHGSWTAAESGPFLTALHGVLGRHGITLDGGPLLPPAPAVRTATDTSSGGEAVRVQFVVEDEHTQLAAALLDELGIGFRTSPSPVTCTRTYRGRSYTVDATGTRFDFITDRARQQAAVDWLVERVELPADDPSRLLVTPVPADEAGLAEVLPMLRSQGAA